MWGLANVINAHGKQLRLTKSRRKRFEGEEREWLETMARLSENALRELRFDLTAQFVVLAWILSLLALGRIDQAVSVYHEFKHIIDNTTDGYWQEPMTAAMLDKLGRLITLLESSPIDLKELSACLKKASAKDMAPIAAYHALVEELRQREDVTNRKARFRTKRSTEVAGTDSPSKGKFPGGGSWLATWSSGPLQRLFRTSSFHLSPHPLAGPSRSPCQVHMGTSPTMKFT